MTGKDPSTVDAIFGVGLFLLLASMGMFYPWWSNLFMRLSEGEWRFLVATILVFLLLENRILSSRTGGKG